MERTMTSFVRGTISYECPNKYKTQQFISLQRISCEVIKLVTD